MPALRVREERKQRSRRSLSPRPKRARRPLSRLRPPVPAAPPQAHPIVRWAFYAFVFSVLFELVELPVPVKPTTMAGYGLVLAAFLQPGVCFRRIPAALWCFATYLYVGVILAIGGDYAGEVLPRLFVLGQLLFMTWIASNLLRDERVARRALAALVASCVALALLQRLGLTASPADARPMGDRGTAFGMDPNGLAGCLSLGLLALVGLYYSVQRNALKLRLLALPVFAVIATTIMSTGSRGGLIALVVGFLAFLLGDLRRWLRPRSALLLLVALGFLLWAGASSPAVRSRFERTIQTRDMTLRERSFPLSWQMILDRPLTGWGPVTNTVELGARLAHPAYPRMDTHNLVLYVFTATGLLGAIPFFLGTALCVWSAWRARRGPHGLLPLAMMATMLIADLSVSGIYWKQHWLVMAFALAAAPAPVVPRLPGDARSHRRGQQAPMRRRRSKRTSSQLAR